MVESSNFGSSVLVLFTLYIVNCEYLSVELKLYPYRKYKDMVIDIIKTFLKSRNKGTIAK